MKNEGNDVIELQQSDKNKTLLNANLKDDCGRSYESNARDEITQFRGKYSVTNQNFREFYPKNNKIL